MMLSMWNAKTIRELRDRYGETQRVFAERLGVSVDALRFWEQGRGVPSGSTPLLLDRLLEDADNGSIRPLRHLQTA